MRGKLYRSRRDSVIAGVCGGFADYFRIDVVLVRIIWAVLILFGGVGLGAYILCAIIIPKERINYDGDIDEGISLNKKENFEEDYKYDEYDDEKSEKTKQYVGLALLFAGGMMMFKIIFPSFSFSFIWPLGLIAGGLYLLSRSNDKNREE